MRTTRPALLLHYCFVRDYCFVRVELTSNEQDRLRGIAAFACDDEAAIGLANLEIQLVVCTCSSDLAKAMLAGGAQGRLIRLLSEITRCPICMTITSKA